MTITGDVIDNMDNSFFASKYVDFLIRNHLIFHVFGSKPAVVVVDKIGRHIGCIHQIEIPILKK